MCVTEYMLSTSAFPELLRLRQKCSAGDLTKLKTSRFKCNFRTQGLRNVDDCAENKYINHTTHLNPICAKAAQIYKLGAFSV